jgi:hypothetical protein
VNIKTLNKQLLDYMDRAMDQVPSDELIDRVEADNNVDRLVAGCMRITISTIVLTPTDDGVTRRFYKMTSKGLKLTGQECNA